MTAPDQTLDILYTCASDLITTGRDILIEAGLPVPDLTHTAVDVGNQPAASVPIGLDDCDQINCVVVGPKIGRAGSNMARGAVGFVWTCTFRFVLWRCHMYGVDEEVALNPPQELVNQVARDDLRDKWQLARGFAYRWANGTLFPSYPEIGATMVTFTDIQTIGPQGGVRGTLVPIDLALEAITYDPNNPNGQ